MIIKNKDKKLAVNNLIELNTYADLIQAHKETRIMNLLLKKSHIKSEENTYTKFDSFSLTYENNNKCIEVIMSEEQYLNMMEYAIISKQLTFQTMNLSN